jgi:hypothetical protein
VIKRTPIGLAITWLTLAPLTPVRAQELSRTSALVQESESQPDVPPAVSSGTLNLVLANRNGFVIVTDSRRSSVGPFRCFGETTSPRCEMGHASPTFYCDDSQKLFRTGPESAMAIAGFANDRVEGTPLDLQIGAILRKKFGTNGLPGDTVFGDSGGPKRTAVRQVGDWSILVLQPALMELLALRQFQYPGAADTYKFIVTIAETSNGEPPRIRQIKFLPTEFEEMGYSGPITRWFDVDDKEFKADHFVYASAGLDNVARQVLDGPIVDQKINVRDLAIKKYLVQKAAKHVDGMSLGDMTALALAILRATKKEYSCWVNGADEIGVFSSKRNLQWLLPRGLASTTSVPARIVLLAGLAFNPAPVRKLSRHWWGEYQEPFIETDEGKVVQQFFLANEFSRVTIRVDGNYFVGNTFDAVTFLYDGGEAHFRNNQFVGPCTLEIPPEVRIDEYPSGPGVIGGAFPPLAACQLVRRAKVEHDDSSTIGRELHLQYEDCPPRKGGCAALVPR